jgi:hypothetical protein
MGLDSPPGDPKLLGRFLVRRALRNFLEDFDFPDRQQLGPFEPPSKTAAGGIMG